jgi:hypothetical protein
VQSQIAATNMHMRDWPGRTHRFLQVPSLYPFGFGLSYTQFRYSQLTVAEAAAESSGRRWTVGVSVANVGTAVSDEVVLVFAAFEGGSEEEEGDAVGIMGAPARKLVAFRRLRDLVPQQVRPVRLAALSGLPCLCPHSIRSFIGQDWVVSC